MAKKKAARVILGTVGVLAILGLSATVAYYANSSVKDWVDSEWSKLTDHDSTEKGSIVDEVTSPDGLLSVKIYSDPQVQGVYQKNVGKTFTAVGTLNSDATDQRVHWSCDSTYLSVDKSYSNSGGSVTFTCNKIWAGNLPITISSADGAVSTVYNATCANRVVKYEFCNIGIVRLSGGEFYMLHFAEFDPTDGWYTCNFGSDYLSFNYETFEFKYHVQSGDLPLLFLKVTGEDSTLPVTVEDPDTYETGTELTDMFYRTPGELEFVHTGYKVIAEEGGIAWQSYTEPNERLAYVWLGNTDPVSTVTDYSSTSGTLELTGKSMAVGCSLTSLNFSKATSVTASGTFAI
jgi:hypothetical protein